MISTWRFYLVFASGGIACLVSAVILIDAFFRRRAVSRKIHILRYGCALYLALMILLVVDCYAEPYWPEIARVQIKTPKWPGGRPLRLVQFGDTHSDPKARLELRLPELIQSLRPDIVVFTGDAINSRDGLTNFKECLTRIAQQCPTFAVRGNWDDWWFADTDLFGGTGVKALDGTAARFAVEGHDVWIGGAALTHPQAIAGIFSAAPPDAFKILLYHYPSAWPEASSAGADLMCAGDTHGGQLALPLIGPLIRIDRGDGVFYGNGLHRMDGVWLYVNRGIGMEGGLPPVRLFCRPEITLIEISAQ